MSEWKEVAIGDIAILKNGKKRPNGSGSIPVYGGNGIMDYVDSYNDENCIAIGRVGAYCGCVYLTKGKVWISDNAISAKANQNVNNVFLYYLLGSLNLNRHRIGGAQPLMTQDLINRIRISLPPIEEQSAIASILSSLDSKIENNRKICANLEAQAQALFKHWFIDFAPFKDGKFVESELGMIPEGWRVGTLGEIADITMGQSPSGSSYNEDGNGSIFYQGRTDFGFRFPSIRLFTTEPKRYAEPLSTLLSVRAPVGDINVATVKCCIGRGLASIKSKYNHHSFIYYLLKSKKRIFDVYNGEGTVFGSINKETLNGLSLVVPPVPVVKAFNDLVEGLDCMILENNNENLRLSALRDTLLPKLMSGAIKV